MICFQGRVNGVLHRPGGADGDILLCVLGFGMLYNHVPWPHTLPLTGALKLQVMRECGKSSFEAKLLAQASGKQPPLSMH